MWFFTNTEGYLKFSCAYIMINWDLSQDARWFSICKSINVMHHINRLKNKNYMIISIDAQKVSDKFNIHLWWKQNFNSMSIKENIPQQFNKSQIWQTSNQHHVFPLSSGIRQECPLWPLLLNIVFEVLGIAIRQEKKINGIQSLEKEVKLSLSEDDMILYIEILKTPQEKLLELI